jgi:hypothetical protein
MATTARLLSRDVPETDSEFDTLKTVGLFCAAGLFMSVLLLATYGLDLSPGLF